MAKDLKGTWKETGVGLGHAFRNLGKTLIKTGANAVKKADEWANRPDSEDQQPEQQNEPAKEEQ